MGLVTMVEMVVYFDEDYPSSWISREWSCKIVEFLEDEGFVRKNAKELRMWLKGRLAEKDAEKVWLSLLKILFLKQF